MKNVFIAHKECLHIFNNATHTVNQIPHITDIRRQNKTNPVKEKVKKKNKTKSIQSENVESKTPRKP